MSFIYLSIILFACSALSFKQEKVHCPSHHSLPLRKPSHYTSSEPKVYPTYSDAPKYTHKTTCKTSKSISSIAHAYSSAISSYSLPHYSTTCEDHCASAIATATDGCSSLFATTVYPSTVTTTIFATNIDNTTFSSIVSTETDISTETVSESTLFTTGTTTIDTVVGTDTITDTQTVTSTTGTVTVTQQAASKRSLRSHPACTNPAQYSSACSCAGVTSTTIIAPTPTATVTSIIQSKLAAPNSRRSTLTFDRYVRSN